MALIKQIILPNGIEINYHRISSLIKNGNILDVSVTSYVSENYRQESIDKYAYINNYIFEDVDSNISFESTYQLLKTLPIFKDAIDN